jgi:aminoglycoside phosphotransferase family enzyme/predicted kinase
LPGIEQEVDVNCPRHVLALQRSLEAGGEGPVDCIETHISCVLLARDRVYKFKKPLTLPFLDYGSLEARQRCCEEEVRLNRRLAPMLYLGVGAITGTPDAPQLDGEGPVLDWAVCMRRFPGGSLFSERLLDGALTTHDIDRLAATLARFHEAAPVAAEAAFGKPALRLATALDTAESLAGHGVPARLTAWLRQEAEALAPLWTARRAAGRVRECHGDLHLDNLLLLDGEPTAFDAVEFDPALRWIDVVDDIAFVAMDLLAHRRGDLAWRFVNAWLDATGDHDGLPALRFSMVYRALVRARVAAMRAGQADRVLRYVETAQEAAFGADPRLMITHGLPGSGKSFVSQRLLEATQAVRLRSDVERMRRFGPGAYGPAKTERTYERLLELAAMALRAGYPVILDAAFLRWAEREQAASLARRIGVPFTILDCRAEPAVLEERVRARALRGDDASEADVSVLRQLAPLREPLTEAELACAIPAESSADAAALAARWRLARQLPRNPHRDATVGS